VKRILSLKHLPRHTEKPRFKKSEWTKDFVLYIRGFVIAGAFYYYSINHRWTYNLVVYCRNFVIEGIVISRFQCTSLYILWGMAVNIVLLKLIFLHGGRRWLEFMEGLILNDAATKRVFTTCEAALKDRPVQRGVSKGVEDGCSPLTLQAIPETVVKQFFTAISGRPPHRADDVRCPYVIRRPLTLFDYF
jgi:hypothetical protein